MIPFWFDEKKFKIQEQKINKGEKTYTLTLTHTQMNNVLLMNVTFELSTELSLCKDENK